MSIFGNRTTRQHVNMGEPIDAVDWCRCGWLCASTVPGHPEMINYQAVSMRVAKRGAKLILIPLAFSSLARPSAVDITHQERQPTAKVTALQWPLVSLCTLIAFEEIMIITGESEHIVSQVDALLTHNNCLS